MPIHFGGHALVDPGQFVLVDVHIHPHGGQVGDFVLVFAGFDVVPFQSIFLMTTPEAGEKIVIVF
jgi:hypothetical protein